MRSEVRSTEPESDPATDSGVRLLEVPTLLEPYAASAMIRLNYLYNDVHFAFGLGQIWVSNIESMDESRLRAERRTPFIGEKILAETLPMRKAMYGEIFG